MDTEKVKEKYEEMEKATDSALQRIISSGYTFALVVAIVLAAIYLVFIK